MNRIALAGLAVMMTALPVASASAMTVASFLGKAEALRRKGPLALLSGDLRLLTGEVKGDFAEIRRERLAAKAAGKPMAFCPPAAGVKLSDRDIMAAMQAVPPAERAGTDTRAALRAMMVRRFPCPA